MAILTLDQLSAGAQPPREFIKAATPTLVVGRPHSLFYLPGIPGPAVAPTPGVAGAALTTYAGQLPFSNPVSGETRFLRLVAQSTVAGQLLLCDRLWHNSGLSPTLTTAQTVNSASWPARDELETTNGNSVYVGLEVTTATGLGAPVLSMSYTDELGNAASTGTGILTGVASSVIGAFYQMGLAAGDNGVRSIQSFTLNATWTSGVFSLVAYRILGRLDLQAGISGSMDAVTCGMTKFSNNTVPFPLFIPAATTPTTITGHAIWSQG